MREALGFEVLAQVKLSRVKEVNSWIQIGE